MPIKRGINIIFLDIDGVLNSRTTLERCEQYIGIEDKKVDLLKEIVNQTKAYIVLTSTWKEFWYHNKLYKYKQDALANYLDAVFERHLLKITAKTYDFDPFKRGSGILDYLDFIKRNGIKVHNYVILDDLIFDYRQTRQLNHLIKTNSNYGLQKRHIIKAISILKENHSKIMEGDN